MQKHAKKKIKKPDLAAVFAFIILAVYSAIILYVLYFAVITAIKSNYDFKNDHNIFGLPNISKYPLSLENFENAFEMMEIQIRGREYAGVFAQFIYAILYAFGSTFVSIFSKVCVAYFCSRYKTKFGGVLYAVAVIAMILPIVGTMASTIEIMRSMGLYNTYPGILLYNASYWGTYFLVFYATFKSMPETYAEAARIDGAGHFTIFFKVYLPLIIPTIFAVAIMQFIAFWSDYQTPMVYLESMPTISYGLFRFQTSNSSASNAPALLSAALIVCIPIVILFIIFKNKIMQNVTAGGIKS